MKICSLGSIAIDTLVITAIEVDNWTEWFRKSSSHLETTDEKAAATRMVGCSV